MYKFSIRGWIIQKRREISGFKTFDLDFGLDSLTTLVIEMLLHLKKNPLLIQSLSWLKNLNILHSKVYKPVNPNSYHPTLLSHNWFTFSANILLSFHSNTVLHIKFLHCHTLHSTTWKFKLSLFIAMQLKFWPYPWDFLRNPFDAAITKQPSKNSLMFMFLLLHYPQLRLVTDLLMIENKIDESFPISFH